MNKRSKEDAEVLKLFSEILKKLSEFNNYVRETGITAADPSFLGRYYAFDPGRMNDTDYYKYIVLINSIYSILNDSGISVKSHGYTYIKDAVCIVIDLNSLDICLTKDVYPLIAKKYKVKALYSIEHNIRNAIESAYFSPVRQRPSGRNIMRCFDTKPSNKEFILKAAQKVQDLLAEEAAGN